MKIPENGKAKNVLEEQTMFNKILIANRGEIAVRVIRACKEMNIRTVAVVSEADRDCLHALLADETICIGGNSPKESYLNKQNILAACEITGADAIHPGFGFLSEDAEFAEICARCNIKFIGPDATSIAVMGDKAMAKSTMKAGGVPTIPGSDGEVDDLETAFANAAEIGYPLLIKAAAGGGGRGIRLVEDENQLENAFNMAREEAISCFGNGAVYMEKYLTNTRHVEIQIIADEHGNVVHLFERDCSMQRRKQKVIEEAPCAGISAETRFAMGDAAVKAALACNYKNAGTVEFLLNPDGTFYFMEMNTRVQVEHPITEMITGVDIVKTQIRIAAGEPLGFTQEMVGISGHSIECRINAENPENNFAPSFGMVKELFTPGGFGVRFDSQLYAGYKIPPFYDSMIGKLIVHAENRDAAIDKMKSALSELIVDGIDSNIKFQFELLCTEQFKSGNYTTDTIEKLMGNA